MSAFSTPPAFLGRMNRKIGPEAKTSIPSLTDLLRDKDEQVRKAAAAALEKIKNEKR